MATKVLLVSSSGGHLAQLLRLRSWWEQHDRVWVTFDTPDATSRLADERTIWAYWPTTRNVPNLLRNLRLAMTTLRAERPDIVVSDGAGVAVPFFAVARLLGVRTVFLEVYDRIDTPTLSARLCRPFTQLLVLQWEEQRRIYPHGTVVGQLL